MKEYIVHVLPDSFTFGLEQRAVTPKHALKEEFSRASEALRPQIQEILDRTGGKMINDGSETTCSSFFVIHATKAARKEICTLDNIRSIQDNGSVEETPASTGTKPRIRL